MPVVRATPHASSIRAIAAARSRRGLVAALLNGRPYTLSRAEAERLAAAGGSFAYLFSCRGRVMTVPVN